MKTISDFCKEISQTPRPSSQIKPVIASGEVLIKLFDSKTKKQIKQLSECENAFVTKFLSPESNENKALLENGFSFDLLYAKPSTLAKTFKPTKVDRNASLCVSGVYLPALIVALQDCTGVESTISNTNDYCVDFHFTTKSSSRPVSFIVRFYVDYGVVKDIGIFDYVPEIRFTEIKDLSFIQVLGYIAHQQYIDKI